VHQSHVVPAGHSVPAFMDVVDLCYSFGGGV